MLQTSHSENLRRLGDFEIHRELGRGGMGVVYEARQVSLNRRVAIKVLSAGLGLTEKAVQRFRREAEAAGKLHHTNIVPIYATAEVDGTHFSGPSENCTRGCRGALPMLDRGRNQRSGLSRCRTYRRRAQPERKRH